MIKTTDEAGNTKHQCVKCPVCGSKKKHYEEASKRAIKMGLAKSDYLTCLLFNNQIMVDPAMETSVKEGDTIPTMLSAIDICYDCGCVYAPMVIAGKGKKAFASSPTKIILPPGVRR